MNVLRTLLACAITSITVSMTSAAVIDHDQKPAVKFKPTTRIRPSGGLIIAGASDGNCIRIAGLRRSAWYNGIWAIMYSWYFPKEQPSSGIGHPHDWENVIIWISYPALDNATVITVSASAHGGYNHYYPPAANNLNGNAALVDYDSVWPIDHRFRITTQSGDSQPLIMWDQLTTAAQTALQNTDFGSADAPMKDGSFESKLAEAWYQ